MRTCFLKEIWRKISSISFGIIFLLLPVIGQASDAWSSPSNWFWTEEWFFVRHRNRIFTVCADLGMGYTLHPTTVNAPTTPPKMLLFQGHLTFWYRYKIGVYGVLSYSAFNPSAGTQIYGGGLKLSLITLTALSHEAWIKGASIQLVGEYVYYSIKSNETGSEWTPKGTMIRSGLAVNWGLNGGGLYLNTTVLFENLQSNLFISPYVGIGWEF